MKKPPGDKRELKWEETRKYIVGDTFIVLIGREVIEIMYFIETNHSHLLQKHIYVLKDIYTNKLYLLFKSVWMCWCVSNEWMKKVN